MNADQMAQVVAETDNPPPTVALSIRQPWAWLIVHGHKDVENRTWPTKFRGRFLVHASKGMTGEEYEIARIAAAFHGVKIPFPHRLDRGGIVGIATLVDCRVACESPWHGQGFWGFVLRDAKPLPFVPCRGRLNFFSLAAPWP